MFFPLKTPDGKYGFNLPYDYKFPLSYRLGDENHIDFLPCDGCPFNMENARQIYCYLTNDTWDMDVKDKKPCPLKQFKKNK